VYNPRLIGIVCTLVCAWGGEIHAQDARDNYCLGHDRKLGQRDLIPYWSRPPHSDPSSGEDSDLDAASLYLARVAWGRWFFNQPRD